MNFASLHEIPAPGRKARGQAAVAEAPTASVQPNHHREQSAAKRGDVDVCQSRGATDVAVDLVGMNANLTTLFTHVSLQ